MVELAIGIGLTLSLLMSELFGVASAGLVVPGYLALYLDQPGRLAATLLVALVTWLAVRFGISRLVVLYGRRRFGVTILTGFLLNAAFAQLQLTFPAEAGGLRAIGYIVPGLIANTALTQGIWVTLGSTLLVAALVRVILVVLAHV
ncbi:MAG TPA: poly-gamma-glutamate biosynthesis protein PgsC [Vicinamibacterales bacterium]